jgi:hypothetical protein
LRPSSGGRTHMGCIDCMLIASLHADCVPHQVAALIWAASIAC